MADIFNEIDEELRGDQMRRIWATYSGLIVAVAVLIVIGVAGWRGWEYWADKTARADGDKYLAALQLSSKGDYQGAQTALKGLETDGNAGYRALSRMRSAAEMSLAGDQSGALAAFDTVAKDGSVPTVFKGVASIRAAYLALDIEDRDKLEARVKPLAVAGNPWRHAAREILAVAAWKSGDIAAAKSWVDQIETDAETPPDLTNRISVLSSVITAEKKPDAPAATASTAPAPATLPAPAAKTPEPTSPAPAADTAPKAPAAEATPPAKVETPAAPAPAAEPAPAAKPLVETAPAAPAAKVE